MNEKTEDTPEDIESAKIQGWNENYDGDNKKTAREFLETGQAINAVLKDRLDKVSEDNKSINAELSKTRQAMEKLIDFQGEQKNRAVEKAVAELEERRNKAIDEGDRKAVHEIDKEIQDTVKTDTENPEFDSWVKENQWYESDPFLRIEAEKVADGYFNTGLTGKKLYDAVKNHVKELYPSKFSNPNREEPSAAESSHPSNGKAKKTFADLPAEAKQAYEEFKDHIPGLTKQKWVENYEWD